MLICEMATGSIWKTMLKPILHHSYGSVNEADADLLGSDDGEISRRNGETTTSDATLKF